MAKQIKMTEEATRVAIDAFLKYLRNGKFPDGKLSFQQTLNPIQRKATIFFTEIAWVKMTSLVSQWDKEIAWHGIAKRGDDPEKDEYIISDILVYPQEVDGTNVNTDQRKYEEWLSGLDENTFNNLRFQGHSHVNMSTSPSSVDMDLYDSLLSQLGSDMFYIFMIINKRGEKTIKLYDMKKNVYFETSDCTVKMIDGGLGLYDFLEDAKTQVKDRPVVKSNQSSVYAYNNMNYGGGAYCASYGSYYDTLYGKYNGATEKTQPAEIKAEAEKEEKIGGNAIKVKKVKPGFKTQGERRNRTFEMWVDDDDLDDFGDDEIDYSRYYR